MLEPGLHSNSGQIGHQQHRAFVTFLFQRRTGPKPPGDRADALLADGGVGGDAHVDLAQSPFENADLHRSALNGLLRHHRQRQEVALRAIHLSHLSGKRFKIGERDVHADVRRRQGLQRGVADDAVTAKYDRLQHHLAGAGGRFGRRGRRGRRGRGGRCLRPQARVHGQRGHREK